MNPGKDTANIKADKIKNKTSEHTVLRLLVEYKSNKLTSPNVEEG